MLVVVVAAVISFLLVSMAGGETRMQPNLLVVFLAAAVAICALVVAGAAALPGSARASADQSMTFEAPVDLADPATRTPALDEIQSFGVRSLRIVLLWQNVAPDPTSRVKPVFDTTDPNNPND